MPLTQYVRCELDLGTLNWNCLPREMGGATRQDRFCEEIVSRLQEQSKHAALTCAGRFLLFEYSPLEKVEDTVFTGFLKEAVRCAVGRASGRDSRPRPTEDYTLFVDINEESTAAEQNRTRQESVDTVATERTRQKDTEHGVSVPAAEDCLTDRDKLTNVRIPGSVFPRPDDTLVVRAADAEETLSDSSAHTSHGLALSPTSPKLEQDPFVSGEATDTPFRLSLFSAQAAKELANSIEGSEHLAELRDASLAAKDGIGRILAITKACPEPVQQVREALADAEQFLQEISSTVGHLVDGKPIDVDADQPLPGRRIIHQANKFCRRFEAASEPAIEEFNAWLRLLAGRTLRVQDASDVVQAIENATKAAGRDLILDGKPAHLYAKKVPRGVHARIDVRYYGEKTYAWQRVGFPPLSTNES